MGVPTPTTGASARAEPRPATRFPERWIDGTDRREVAIQSWAYDEGTTIFRQSLTTHFEAPFVLLLSGRERSLLIDTGTGDADVRRAVDAQLAGRAVDLLVSHSHAHTDHVGGDRQFEGRARTVVVGHSPAAVADELGLRADGSGTIDLGDRVIDVLAIPGHEASHVAFYDRSRGLLLTGDTLYPGRLYVRDWAAYRSSIARMVDWIDDGRQITDVVGAHIELSADGVEYEPEATAHPNEHRLELGAAVLEDLHATVSAMGNAPVRQARPSYVVVPLT